MSGGSERLVNATAELSVEVSRLPGAGRRQLINEARQLAVAIAHKRGLSSEEREALADAAGAFGAPFPDEVSRPLREVHVQEALVAPFEQRSAGNSAVQDPPDDALSSPLHVGRYRIERLVGTGATGSVYRAHDELTARPVALELMWRDEYLREPAVDHMMRVATILSSVSHPGIPQFFECGMLDKGGSWIATELVEGVALSHRMQRGALDADAVIDFAVSVAEVLAAAHARGITHCNLKPDSIVLVPDDARFPVRVIGWGFPPRSLAHGTPAFKAGYEALGTYMAPEQARSGTIGGHCDVYGLGVVAYQALTGRPPFLGANLYDVLFQHINRPPPALAPRCQDAPSGLLELVERMLAKNVKERPSAAEVRASLCTFRAARQPPPNTRIAAESSSGVPTPVFEDTTTPSIKLERTAWPDSED